jgi:hypothetical protein
VSCRDYTKPVSFHMLHTPLDYMLYTVKCLRMPMPRVQFSHLKETFPRVIQMPTSKNTNPQVHRLDHQQMYGVCVIVQLLDRKDENKAGKYRPHPAVKEH